jgi:molybdenum cofactor biosynthesis protein B
MSHDHHPRDQNVKATFALLVTSDSRTPETDETGKLAKKLLSEAGHEVVEYGIVPNDSGNIIEWIATITETSETQIIITSGGTGIGSVDKTVDIARVLFEKELPGFGEYFRRLSFDEIGMPGLMSRSTAGIINKKIIFCLPGSRGAMRTALNEIILPSIGHMLWELNRR